ncbi:hypothetical protein Pan189_34100 [Stratiformator vulcanicus]|uniref:Uncharacterized protein n=1 Tax=Stratiformator vulcanicus TaxID=2527980 RepID=A0A517R590_9PLAN|nr:hypothetical protein Pan189_34100 [Stratiformator vulcanicus]
MMLALIYKRVARRCNLRATRRLNQYTFDPGHPSHSKIRSEGVP